MLQVNLARMLINVMKPENKSLVESSYPVEFGTALPKSTFPDKYWFMLLQVKDPVLFPLLA